MNLFKKVCSAAALLMCSICSFAQPNSEFTYSTVEGCSPLTVSFTSAEQGSGYTHTWDFGNGIVTNAPANPQRVYNAPGSYTVKHTISGTGSNTTTKINLVVVHPTPNVDFSGTPLTGCPPLTVNFTNRTTSTVPGGLSYRWVLGNGATPATSTSQHPSAVYSTPGTHNVTLEVINSKGCKSSKTIASYVTVNNIPQFDFNASQTEFCTGGGSATYAVSAITGAAGPYSYSWNLGNGTSAVAAPTQAYSGTGPVQYTVSLTITAANGCSNTVTKTNYIKIHNPKPAFTAPASACVNTPVNFTNSSTGNTNVSWNFGDGLGVSGAVNPTYTYTFAGTFTVILTASQGACHATTSKTITIHPLPNPIINQSPKNPCPAPQTITFSTTPAMSSYSWTFQNTTGMQTSNGSAPSQTYTQNGLFPFEVKITDGNGCVNTKKDAVNLIPLYIDSKVNGHPTDSGCAPFTALFRTALWEDVGYNKPYPHSIKTVLWKFGDGGTSTALYPSHIYTDSGVFTVTVDVETVNGCKISDTIIVKAGYKPIIYDIKAVPRQICPRKFVDFVASVKGYSPLVFKWEYGDGGDVFVDDSTTTHKYGCADTFDVILNLYHRGCAADTAWRKDFIEVFPPCAQFKDSINCINMLRVSFKDTSKGDSSRQWFFGDGGTSTEEYPTHTYPAAGTYTVTLIAHNSKSGCYDTLKKQITVGRNQPTMTANKTKLCKGDSVTFKASEGYPSGSAVGFYWYVNGVQQGFGSTYTHTFAAPGQYTIKVVSLTVDNQCKDSTEKTDWITVGGPIVGFTSDVTRICASGTINFTDTSSSAAGTNLTQRLWSYGTTPPATFTTTNKTASYTYWTRGLYDVKLVVTDDLGCKDSLDKPRFIEVKKPVALYTPVTPACVNMPIDFNNQSSSAQDYTWETGDGNILNGSTVSYIYTYPGVFNTTLVATDDLGCKDTARVVITTTKPVAAFTVSDSMSICPPLITSFDASTSARAKTYLWDFNDAAAPGTKKNHTVAYNDKKEYKVRLVVTDSVGCKDTAYKTLQVLGYEGAFSYSPIEGCAPLTVNFVSHVKGNVPTMIWDFGDGNTMPGSYLQPNVSYTYKNPGKYIPHMVFNNNQGCSVGSDGTDTIIVDGVIPDFDHGPACQYSTVQFFDKSTSVASPVTALDWTFHDGSTSNLADPELPFTTPGKYPVKLRLTNARGCADSILKDIEIHVPIEMSVGNDTIICLTDSVQLFPSGGVSYLWSPPGTLSCLTCINPYAFPKVKTKYKVISTDINGCHDTANLEVGIKTHVVSAVAKGGEICQEEKITLSVTGGQTYLWAPSESLDNATSATPTAFPMDNTKYRVVAYEGRCIPDTNYVDVIVHPKPTVTVRGEQTIVAGTSADIIASGNHIIRFLWSPAATLSCSDCSDPVATPYKTTTYTVKVFTKYECTDSADVTIKVLCDETQLYIPNTFTPNGDGMNDIFMVRGTGIDRLQTFRIYSRWGEVLFERNNVTVNDKTHGWDGSFNGTQLPPDVYIYIVEAYCENGELLKMKGDVTIIR